jgi:hypothetical protein
MRPIAVDQRRPGAGLDSKENMLRFFALAALFCLMSGCGGISLHSSSVDPSKFPPGATVLRVEVLEISYPDWPIKAPCRDGMQCIEFTLLFKYRARVKEVVVGEWAQSEVQFARMQHSSMRKDATDDCYVVLVPASPVMESKLGIPFVLKDLLSVKFDKAKIKALLKND